MVVKQPMTFVTLFMCKCWHALWANMSHRDEGERRKPPLRESEAQMLALVQAFHKRRTNSGPNKSKRVAGAIRSPCSNKKRDVRCQGQERVPKDKDGGGQVARRINGAATRSLLDSRIKDGFIMTSRGGAILDLDFFSFFSSFVIQHQSG